MEADFCRAFRVVEFWVLGFIAQGIGFVSWLGLGFAAVEDCFTGLSALLLQECWFRGVHPQFRDIDILPRNELGLHTSVSPKLTRHMCRNAMKM